MSDTLKVELDSVGSYVEGDRKGTIVEVSKHNKKMSKPSIVELLGISQGETCLLLWRHPV